MLNQELARTIQAEKEVRIRAALARRGREADMNREPSRSVIDRLRPRRTARHPLPAQEIPSSSVVDPRPLGQCC